MKNNNWYNHVQSQRDNFNPIDRYLQDTARDAALIRSYGLDPSYGSSKDSYASSRQQAAQKACTSLDNIKANHITNLNNKMANVLRDVVSQEELSQIQNNRNSINSPNVLKPNSSLKKALEQNPELLSNYKEIISKISEPIDAKKQQILQINQGGVEHVEAAQNIFKQNFRVSEYFDYINNIIQAPSPKESVIEIAEEIKQGIIDSVNPDDQGDQGNTPPPVINAQNNANADHPVISRFEQDNIPHDAGDDQTNTITSPPNTQIGNSSDQPPSSDDTLGAINTARANRILNNPNHYPSDVNQRAEDFFKDQCHGYRVYFDEMKKPFDQRDENLIQRASRDINEYEDTKDRMLGRKPVSNAQSSEQEQKQEEDRPANVAPQQQQNAGQNNPTIEELMARIRELEATNAKKDDALRDKDIRIDVLEEQLQHAPTDEQIREIVAENEVRIGELQQESERKDLINKNVKDQLKVALDTNQEYKGLIKDLRSDKEHLNNKIDKLEDKLDAKSETIHQFKVEKKKEIKELKKIITKHEETNFDLKQELNKLITHDTNIDDHQEAIEVAIGGDAVENMMQQ